MSLVKLRSMPFTATASFPTGTENLGVGITWGFDYVVARTEDVVEVQPGIWQAQLVAPDTAGDYLVLWNIEGDDDSWVWEALTVTTGLYIATPGGEDPEPDDTLIAKLRELTGVGDNAYKLAGTSFWTDAQLAAKADDHRLHNESVPVTMVTGTEGQIDVTGMVSPTNPGTVSPAAAFEIDQRGRITFTVTPAGPVTWTGTSYDLQAAAIEVLEAWIAALATSYDATIDGQSLKRSQVTKALRDRVRDLKRDRYGSISSIPMVSRG